MHVPVPMPLIMPAHTNSHRRASLIQLNLQSPPLQKRQTPTALFAFPINVLPAHPAPEEIIVRERFPRFRHLGRAPE
jgi:hypothetical protein